MKKLTVDNITSFPQGATWMQEGRDFWGDEVNQAGNAALEARSNTSCCDRIALLSGH